MKSLLVLLFLSIVCSAQIRPDKILHYTAGAGITATGYAISYKITKKRGLSLCIGAGLAILADAGKELIFDKAMGHGQPSWGDSNWTMAGMGSAVLTVKIFQKRKKRCR